MQRMRKQGVSVLLVLGFMAATVLTAGPVQAASGNGPYYATPSWDQVLPASTRFLILTDWGSAAVLDRETGLVWQRTPDSARFTGDPTVGTIWSQAVHNCYLSSGFGIQRMGWRLPTVEELASLVSPFESGGQKLPAGHPFLQVISTGYWTATTYQGLATHAYIVTFGNGFPGIADKDTNNGVWCVRGGHGYDSR